MTERDMILMPKFLFGTIIRSMQDMKHKIVHLSVTLPLWITVTKCINFSFNINHLIQFISEL